MPQTPSRSLFFQNAPEVILLVIFLVFPVGVFADSLPPEFIPLDEISRGMTGYGLTVFEGTTIDTFSVTVIGIQKNNRPAGNMLLVEVGGHGLELSAIAQGMSGSPIYIDGRFAGALAFGWAGALRPIAGVTPAAEMLALPVDLPAGKQTATGKMSLHSLLPPNFHENALAQELSLDRNIKPLSGVVSGWPKLFDESWPSPETVARKMLHDLGVQTGSSGSGADGWGALVVQATGPDGMGRVAPTHNENATLQPGSACGIALVEGDAQLGATGTVTWVQDDHVFAFGHPFMQRGPVDLPLFTAEVLTVFPSRQMSFKMATMGSAVGSVHHDQRAGISGRLGKVPAMIPVQVGLVLSGEEGSGQTSLAYDFQVVDDPLLSPTLVFWCLYNSLLAQADDASLQTVGYHITTTWEGAGAVADEPLVLAGITAGPGSVQALAGEWMAPLSMLLNNSFQPVKLKSVQAQLVLSRPMNTAKIIGLSGPRVATVPGETVVFKAEIESRHGQRQFIGFEFALPENLSPGPYRVVVTSAAELFSLEPLRAPGIFEVTSLAGVMEILKTPRARDMLVLAILAPGKGMVLQGREMQGMPNRLNKLIKKGNMQAKPTLADYILRRESEVPWALEGHAVRVMHVKDGGQSLKMERRP